MPRKHIDKGFIEREEKNPPKQLSKNPPSLSTFPFLLGEDASEYIQAVRQPTLIVEFLIQVLFNC